MEKTTATAVDHAIMMKENLSVTVLSGKAPEQHNPSPVEIDGTITAPRLFLEGRLDTFDKNKSHAMVSLTEGTISLRINEQSVVNKYNVHGTIEIGKVFKNLGINTDREYNPIELASRLRLMRSIFKTHSDHLNITSTLRNIKAKIDTEVEELDDRRGNTTSLFKQALESNMPDSIVLSLPLIEGEEPTEIEVSVILEMKQGVIVCYLESIEAQDLIDQERERITLREVEIIKNHTTVIYH